MNHRAAIGRSPTAAGISAILLWSTTVALARSAAEQLGPVTAGFSVYLFAGLFLTAYRFGRGRSIKPRQGLSGKYVFGCGALFVLYTTAFFFALGLAKDRNQTVEVGLLNYLWPALTLLFSLFLLGNRGGWGLIPGTLLALGGVFLVVTQGATVSWEAFAANLIDNPAAYGLGLLAAVTWGLYSNLARRWGTPRGGGSVHIFLLASATAFLVARVFASEEGGWSVRAAVEVGVLGVATALGYLFWDLAMRAGNMVLVAAFSYLTPFLSTVVVCVYLGVRPDPRLWVGCVLIVAGSYLSWRSVRSPEAANPDARPQSSAEKEEN
jgi:drug/metabolite transporter (DMT)-like permease